jgi:hypothetical protein
VAYKPVAKQGLCKQRPFGKHVPATVNTHTTIQLTGCFLCGPCQDVITRTVGAVSQL